MKPVALIAVLAFLQQPATPPTSLPGEPCTPSSVVGTWQFVERTRGPATDLGDLQAYKHVTPTHFIVTRVSANGLVDSAHGGSQAFVKGAYTETLEFFSAHQRFAKISRGTQVSYQCAMDGNEWRIGGKFNDVAVEERWRRVGSGPGA
jgi:hypothetical protein